jgi:hypothetical protein
LRPATGYGASFNTILHFPGNGSLLWLENTLKTSVESGLDMNEVMQLPLPERFSILSLSHSEFTRSVIHRYPIYEQKMFSTNPN